jgi:tetratricopeptide (TPR) repeat protein
MEQGRRSDRTEAKMVNLASQTMLACLILAGGGSHGHEKESLVGVKVVTKYMKPLRVKNRAATSGTTTFRVYTVERASGSDLWLVSGSVKGWALASDVVPLADAVDFYTSEIVSNPDNAMAYNLRGLVWQEEGKPDVAIADYNEAIHLNPKDQTAFYNRGNAWREKKVFEHAIDDYTEAIHLDPKYAWAYYNRGIAWRGKQDFDRAIADFNEAIRLYPKFATAYNNRAWLWATWPDERFRDGHKAVESALKACELDSWKVPNDLGTLAASYAESGDFDQAVKWEQEAMKLTAPDSDESKGRHERLALYRDNKPYHEP